ncbi:MAG: gamma-glutamylcyclotransferase family protein [Planctomycetaceae bacterium]
MTDSLPLFVYGTLRRGEVNHHLLAESYDRSLPATLRGYRRSVAAHGFPVILPATGQMVEGELYFPRPHDYLSTLSRCDVLEGILPGGLAGEHYRRKQVLAESTEGTFAAWAYVAAAAE